MVCVVCMCGVCGVVVVCVCVSKRYRSVLLISYYSDVTELRKVVCVCVFK